MSTHNCVVHSLATYYKIKAGIPVYPQEGFDTAEFDWENEAHVPGTEKTWVRALTSSTDLAIKIEIHGGNVWQFFNLLTEWGPTGRWRVWEKWCRLHKLKPYDLTDIARRRVEEKRWNKTGYSYYEKCVDTRCPVCVRKKKV